MSKEVNSVELSLPCCPRGRKVVLNGMQLGGVVSVSLSAEKNGPSVVTITLFADVNYQATK